MRYIVALLFIVFPALCLADSDIVIPEGFVLQPLVETDGQIARPKDWFYTTSGTPSGWLWTISKEDPSKGPYKTGLRIQLLVGVAQRSGKSREAFAKNFIANKRSAEKVVRECAQTDMGQFFRQCIEVLESLPPPTGPADYHILYSVMWGKDLDMVVISTFGAPPQTWTTVAPIADAMSQFRLIGPNLGK